MKKLAFLFISIINLTSIADVTWQAGDALVGFVDPATGNQITAGNLIQIINVNDQAQDIFTVMPVATFTSQNFGLGGFGQDTLRGSDITIFQDYFIRIYNKPTVIPGAWYGDSTQVPGVRNSDGTGPSPAGQFHVLNPALPPIQDWSAGLFLLNQQVAVPEPSSMVLFALGLIAFLKRAHRKTDTA